MGGVTSSMAAKFAFFPPSPPTYKLVTEEATGMLLLNRFPHRENVEMARVQTRKGNEVVSMYVRNPLATSTLLYSHGNAADLGQMYELFVELSIHLRVNLVGFVLEKWVFFFTFIDCFSFDHRSRASSSSINDGCFSSFERSSSSPTASPSTTAAKLFQRGLCPIFFFTSSLVRYDYSGYGQSTGKPSEHNTYADIEAVYKYLVENYGVKEEEVILYGQSVGSGPTLDLATRLPRLRAVVLHSPILSGLRVMYPVKRTYWFDIYKKVVSSFIVLCLLAVDQGTADEVVDWSHGRQLWELCKEKYEPLWLKGGNHCDLELFPEYIKHLKKFISTVEKLPSQRSMWRKNTDVVEPSRRSTDHRREKPRNNEHHRASNVDRIDRFRLSYDHIEKSRRSVDCIERSKRSSDYVERGRKSVDRLDRIWAG
ncbi:hypothetical protein QJS04_geneDACA021691 [Acorus gramineus]|uniref:Serine aminopeptidase S33 domain-containing protein n=1 Tax=Acorus gramineus TaxID=55184 RepID=A0AAV9A208_ACOGR|nr:hypothetical protein QJS04_geneDACA021691 [Acorus gramineus]